MAALHTRAGNWGGDSNFTRPPTQRAIVAEIKAVPALGNANRLPVRRMEAKVKAAIDRVWGEAT